MYIQEFILKYCQDILEECKAVQCLFDDEGLEYDYTITDINGQSVKVIQVDNLEIPILDIIGMDKPTFLHNYNSPNSESVYDSYLESICFMCGPDALHLLRNKMKRAAEQLEKECEMMATWSDLND